jgi:hypothetical protein
VNKLAVAAAAVGAALLIAVVVLVLRPSSLPSASARPSPSVPARGPLPELKAGSYAGIRPAWIDWSADGGNIVGSITWSSWTTTEAIGTGQRLLQSCKPNCATGPTQTVPETVVLSQPEAGYFTVIVCRFAGQIAEYQSPAFWPIGAGQTQQ